MIREGIWGIINAMRSKAEVRWAWIGLLWLLVLLTGNLLHPLAHKAGGVSNDCLVCTLQSLPAVPDNSGEAIKQAVEPLWEPLQRISREPSIKYLSPFASSRASRAPPI